jgi:hypothetical protein
VYRARLNQGGWFSFNSRKSEWKSHYADTMFDVFFDRLRIEKSFGSLNINEELLITNNLDFSAVKGKEVLVIGGGPSSKDLTVEECERYDYIFSCNHFFKSRDLSNKKINLALIGDEVNLNGAELNNYLKSHNTILGFEHSSKRSTDDLVRFKKRYDNCFVFLTRYFSRLGYVARACVLAKEMGASKIHFIGMDGFKSQYHHFEAKKNPPPFNDEEKFRDQMKIFYKHMLETYSLENFKNLSDGHPSSIYTGIMKELLNEED